MEGRTDGLMSEWIPEDSEAEFVSPLAAITSPDSQGGAEKFQCVKRTISKSSAAVVMSDAGDADDVGREEILLHFKSSMGMVGEHA